MNNKELVTLLANEMKWSTDETSRTLATLGSVITKNLADNNTVAIQGFGQFEVKKKNERISVNPSNGKRYLVPPKLVPIFRPGTTIKNRLKGLELE